MLTSVVVKASPDLDSELIGTQKMELGDVPCCVKGCFEFGLCPDHVDNRSITSIKDGGNLTILPRADVVIAGLGSQNQPLDCVPVIVE